MAVKQNLPIIAIVGRANVGKSSLFNRLVGARQAITHETPGTTRDSVHGIVEWTGRHFVLVDTAGLKPPGDEFETQIQDQISIAAETADLIILVADATTIVTTEDLQAGKLALKSGKPVVLAINKIDAAGGQPIEHFSRLGIKDMISVSALHGQGTGDLLQLVTKDLSTRSRPQSADITVAILGRPNVGKSSLLNNLAGKQQAVVSERAGTTRDVGEITVKYHNQTIRLFDTAGLRRSGKIERGIEQFSTLRTLGAIADSDICMVMIDATEPAVAGDQHIAGLVTEAGKGLILVANKWDAVEKDDKTADRLTKKIQQEFQFAWWAPLVLTSAVTGQNVSKLFDLIAEIQARRQFHASTPQINRLLQTLVAKHPPAGLKNRHPKLLYVAQTGEAPPTFGIFGRNVDFLHFSYKRYLENGWRENFDFTGTPIRLDFKEQKAK